jgi:hypothetical protein
VFVCFVGVAEVLMSNFGMVSTVKKSLLVMSPVLPHQADWHCMPVCMTTSAVEGKIT